MKAAALPTLNYLVDAFDGSAALALATPIILKRCVGAVPSLAGPPLYAKLGVGWGNSLRAFLALAFMPAPILLSKFGFLSAQGLQLYT